METEKQKGVRSEILDLLGCLTANGREPLQVKTIGG